MMEWGERCGTVGGMMFGKGEDGGGVWDGMSDKAGGGGACGMVVD